MIRLRKKNQLNKNIVFEKKDPAGNVIWGITYGTLWMICAVQVLMVFWMIYTSLKNDLMLFESMFKFPPMNNLQWKNYVKIFDRLQVQIFSEKYGYTTYTFWDMILNGLTLSIVMPISGIVSTVSMAYALSKYNFPGRKFLINLNIVLMVVPSLGSLAASLELNHAIGRYDNLLMMAIMGGTPFGMQLIIYMGMFKAIDNEYMEAARIDGAKELTILFRIILPLAFPTIFIFYAIDVMSTWNNYELPLLWLPSYPNLAFGIYQFQYDAEKYGATLPEVLAGFTIISIPSIIFFASTQKLMAAKVAIGGLKG